eukprot:13419997-Alexandrium_andersonii.AAC.1
MVGEVHVKNVVRIPEQVEKLDQPLPLELCDGSGGDRRSPGMMAEDASSPAAREACGPPAPGAHPREGKLASTRPG